MGMRRSQAEWESLIAELDKSGRSVAEFSARRSIRARTLQWWRWKLRRAQPIARNAKPRIRLIPVDVVESAAPADVASPAPIAIALGDITLRIAVGTEPAYVASLIAVLRGRC